MADTKKRASTTYFKIRGKSQSLWSVKARSFWVELKRPIIALARIEIAEGRTIGSEIKSLILDALDSIRAYAKKPKLENELKLSLIEKERVELRLKEQELERREIDKVASLKRNWSLTEAQAELSRQLQLKDIHEKKLKELVASGRLLITTTNGELTFILQKDSELFDKQVAHDLAIETFELSQSDTTSESKYYRREVIVKRDAEE
jgi:hypothetical protein